MALARACPEIELVSADSMQVYRGMDIGTAKPSASEQLEVRHHLIDITDPSDDYHLGRFQVDAAEAFADIRSRGKVPVLVGGTGLYLRAVTDSLDLPGRFPDVVVELDANPNTYELFSQLQELDPLAASRMEATNRRRVMRALEVTLGSGRPFSAFGPGMTEYGEGPFQMVIVDLPREQLYDRISRRYHQQMDEGFLAECSLLLASERGLSRTARQALGYKELFEHLEGDVTLDDALELAIQRTKRFARRQQRWFRRDPRLIWRSAEHNPLDLLPDLLKDFEPCA